MATKIISVSNIKGGVGKTTLTALLTAFAPQSTQTLLLDADPQGTLTDWAFHLLSDERKIEFTHHKQHSNLMSVLRSEKTIQRCLFDVNDKVRILPSTVGLEKSLELFSEYKGKEQMLRSAINDYFLYTKSDQNAENEANVQIIIDTAGDIGLLSLMSLVSANTVLVPIATSIFSIDSVNLILQRVSQVQQFLNSSLKEVRLIPTMVHRQRRTHRECLDHLRNQFPQLLYWQESEVLMLQNRAEVENFLHDNVRIPRRSPIYSSLQSLVSQIA